MVYQSDLRSGCQVEGSTRGGGREAVRLGLGRYPEGTTGKSPMSEPVRWAGGGMCLYREHGLHRICLSPFWSLDAIAFIMAASVFYQNETKLLEGRPAAYTPLIREPSSPWELRFGGGAGMMGVQGEEGRRRGYGISCAVLPTWCSQLLTHLTAGVKWALRGAHN